MSELRLCLVQKSNFWTSSHMMREIKTLEFSKGWARTRCFKSAKDCDGQHSNWSIGCCSSSEVLNQPFEFTGQNICLNGIKTIPTHKFSMYLLYFDWDLRAALLLKFRDDILGRESLTICNVGSEWSFYQVKLSHAIFNHDKSRKPFMSTP